MSELINLYYPHHVKQVTRDISQNNGNYDKIVSDIALILDDEFNRKEQYNGRNRKNLLDSFNSNVPLKLEVLSSSVMMFKRVDFPPFLLEIGTNNWYKEAYANGIVRFLFHYALKKSPNSSLEGKVSKIFKDLINSFNNLVERNVGKYSNRTMAYEIDLEINARNNKNPSRIKNLRKIKNMTRHYTLSGILLVIGKSGLENNYPNKNNASEAVKFAIEEDVNKKIRKQVSPLNLLLTYAVPIKDKKGAISIGET